MTLKFVKTDDLDVIEQIDEPKGNGHTNIEQPQFNGCLRLEDWLNRELPDPDYLLGNWLTTTSRVLLFAPTGIGKTMLTMGMLMATAAGIDFLHWRGVRQARVLLIDGEMSRRLMQQRLADEASRLGVRPEGMHILSREDVEGFAPLNTPQGQQMVEKRIQEIGGADLIGFDNISSLLVGDQKDGEVWRQTLPWALSLTKRNIGQIWVHHTGHDESHSYGDKTREFQMDTTIQLERAEDDDGQLDVNFKFRFIKARERTPATRADFAAVKIALVADQWTSDAPDAPKAKVSPLGLKFLDALRDATIGNEANRMYGCPAASIEMWRAECVRHGLLDKDKPDSARSLFSKCKLELIGANRVACNDTMAWTITPQTSTRRSSGSGSSGARASPTCSSYEILGPAPAGTRCIHCGKAGGAMQIKLRGDTDPRHERCAEDYLAAMKDPPVKVPDPGPAAEYDAPKPASRQHS